MPLQPEDYAALCRTAELLARGTPLENRRSQIKDILFAALQEPCLHPSGNGAGSYDAWLLGLEELIGHLTAIYKADKERIRMARR